MTGGDGPRRADVAAAGRAVVGGPKSATAARGALLASRPALVLGDGPPVADAVNRGAVEPELADRPGLLLFDAHPEIVELPEIAILEEVRRTCVTNT